MIRELLPPWVVAVETGEDPADAWLYPQEAAVVRGAVDARRREFTTVRHCARAALRELGVERRPLLPGPRGAPLWPPGVVGSMTHCAGLRAAAVSLRRHAASIGIDAEPGEPVPPGILRAIASPREQRHVDDLLERIPGVRWDRLLFSAKEAVYKAWFPLTGRRLDFPDASVEFDPGTGTFLARTAVTGGREPRYFSGRWGAGSGLLATVVTVPAWRVRPEVSARGAGEEAGQGRAGAHA
ncbi:4'-phosphopantetheinyl transferase superfamily protein [Sphaerisporangium rubeum]|uniref:4'-phosphopantetheinyl transferase EntD n=1 Tax=Sphaerisporangium rubeum TaxID=321317 RepID=A0A7X0II22_9ACTN|nr:4'-phosphopantetheinyl transferase EntD [Sphaerisporangium rubeum]